MADDQSPVLEDASGLAIDWLQNAASEINPSALVPPRVRSDRPGFTFKEFGQAPDTVRRLVGLLWQQQALAQQAAHLNNAWWVQLSGQGMFSSAEYDKVRAIWLKAESRVRLVEAALVLQLRLDFPELALHVFNPWEAIPQLFRGWTVGFYMEALGPVG